MIRSDGELRAELLKAGRGAGLALGMAEDIAAATAWYDLAGLRELADVLSHPQAPIRMARVIEALDARALDRGAPFAEYPALWQALTACQDGVPARAARLDVPGALWSRLAELSARTYVPASDQSRAGAGAGDIDND